MEREKIHKLLDAVLDRLIKEHLGDVADAI